MTTIIQTLTPGGNSAIIAPLSQKNESRALNPEHQGPKRLQFNVAFFMSIKNICGFLPLCICFGGLYRAPPKKVGRSLAGVENPMQSTAQYFSILCGGLSPYQGVTAMTSHTQKPAESSQAPAHVPQVKNASTLSPKAKQCMALLKVRCQAVAGSLDMLTAFKDPSVLCSEIMINDAECLLDSAKRLHEALSENDEPKPFKITPPRRVALADLIKQQKEERGLEPLPIESDLLLKRIEKGGHSGQFLADAFISAYRTDKPFSHSLGELIKLDPEAFRLFHQILHIRHISGWSDDHLYKIEQQIIALGGVQ
jgi:hypothetical protein